MVRIPVVTQLVSGEERALCRRDRRTEPRFNQAEAIGRRADTGKVRNADHAAGGRVNVLSCEQVRHIADDCGVVGVPVVSELAEQRSGIAG